jgi:hypothetical protein
MITNKVKVAIIGGAAGIIVAIISAVAVGRTNPGSAGSSGSESNAENTTTVINNLNPQGSPVNPRADLEDVSIEVLDRDTGALVLGAVITVTGPGGKVILQNQSTPTGQYQARGLEWDDYTVKASADNYQTDERTYNLHAVPWEVRLDKLPPPPASMTPLSFAGWNSWGGLTASPRSNTVTLNGAFTSAGYVATGIRGLAGRKLILEIAGTANSDFYNNQLFKLETADGVALIPEELLAIIEDGYIPVIDGRVAFAIPDDFRGRLNMVFYRAALQDLRITAYYE